MIPGHELVKEEIKEKEKGNICKPHMAGKRERVLKYNHHGCRIIMVMMLLNSVKLINWFY